MADQLDINEELGPLFTIKVVHYADSWDSSINPPFSVGVNEPIKQMFTLSVGLKSSTYYGPAGPQGPSGSSGGGAGGSGYEHIQASALTEWIVNHNLDRYPVVGILTTGGIEILADVVHISTNQLRIYFNQPQAGRSIMR